MGDTLRVALAGLGTVGAGVIKLLEENRALIERRAGRAIEVTAVSARDRSRDRGVDLSGLAWEGLHPSSAAGWRKIRKLVDCHSVSRNDILLSFVSRKFPDTLGRQLGGNLLAASWQPAGSRQAARRRQPRPAAAGRQAAIFPFSWPPLAAITGGKQTKTSKNP